MTIVFNKNNITNYDFATYDENILQISDISNVEDFYYYDGVQDRTGKDVSEITIEYTAPNTYVCSIVFKNPSLTVTFPDLTTFEACFLKDSVIIIAEEITIQDNEEGILFSDVIDINAILLYSLNSDSKVLEKSLTYKGFIGGEFKRTQDIKNPVIDVSTAGLRNITGFNYLYIYPFKRYYYVDNITFISKDLTRLTLSEDVLLSFKGLILEQTAYIERQEFSYDLSVVDNLLVQENRLRITETEYTNDFFYTDITDRYAHTYESASPVVVAIGGIPSYVGGAIDPNPDTSSQSLRQLPWETFGLGLVTLYSMSPKALTDYMMSGNMGDLETIFSDLGEYIVGCKCFPFDVTSLATSKTTDNPVKIGNKNATGLTGIRMNAFNNLKVIVSSFNVPRYYQDFRDFAPYTRVSIFLPYIGYVDLPTNEVMGATGLTVTYAFDLIDGTCQAFIRSGNRIIVTTNKSPCALDLPINQKNNTERLRNLIMGSLNIVSGGVASLVGDGGKAGSNLKSSASSFMGFLTEHVTKGRISGGWQSMNSPTSVTVIVETEKWVAVDMDEFKHIHGRPCHKTYKLEDLVGFTQVGEIHFNPMNYEIYQDEIEEIVSLLKTGVIL